MTPGPGTPGTASTAMAAAPDLDALFGADDASAPVLHPALDSAVKVLVADAWPVARGELLGEEAGGSKAGMGRG